MMQTLREIQDALLAESTSMVEITEQYIQAIENTKNLNIYVSVWAEEAREKASALDRKIKEAPETLGTLFGCIVSIKDLICYEKHSVTAASAILEGFESQFSATAVSAILNQDAIIIGSTNCDEFGMGSTNQNSTYGPTLNGHDSNRIPGGSSGGAAVSVQMNTCLVALGTDTGGSVRQPAAFTGLYGFKPTYGLVSRYGLVAYASSFDQVGVFTHDIETMHAVMNTISIADNYDSTMYHNGLYADQDIEEKATVKLAVLSEALSANGLSQDIKNAFVDAEKRLKDDGSIIDHLAFDMMEYLVPCYYILTTAEASSNLSRYDGVRYGYRAEANDLNEMYTKTRSEAFGSEVKKRIMLGSFVLSEAYYDAYFTKAQQVRQIIRSRIESILEEYDAIMIPTTATIAWRFDEKIDPMSIYMSDIYTVIASLCGLPSINVPIGSDSNGSHIGLQLIGKTKGDKALVEITKIVKVL
jgi:aspartyl-tRNA(Asn)/glutamyl-tRNA(Gln) amidotransferase subunit A